jgi:small-conductance mechanosensitive channel
MPAAPVSDWGEALLTSFSSALVMFMSAIPRVIAFAVILIIGWIIASLIAKGVVALLRAVRFNDLAFRSGFSGFVQSMGVHTDSAGLIANVVKWFVRLIALVVAFDALGLPAVSEVLQQLLLWLPNLVVALVILVLAGLAANAVSSIVRGATTEAGFSNPGMLATVARFAIWTFAIVIAINQLGIATTLVNTLFMGFVGALALAAGLAFGLGGRDTAARIVSNWYAQSSGMSHKLARAADAASDQTQQMSSQSSGRTAAQDAEFIPASRSEPRTPAPAHVGGDDRTVDDGTTIRRPMQSPPDPNFGRPLRGTQND